MAWSDAARAAAAEARRRRSQLHPKPGKGKSALADRYPRAASAERQSVAGAIKYARAVLRGRASPPARLRSMLPAWLNAYQATLNRGR